ncbi:hypothetical protein G6F70_005792 [Rhizopus microsporus]|nr:hypothetical protein G6F71_002901 [Rhizopus microsporus]KAG1198447.1 hypothetical protein G6F70_005792 [Rhizopus microsporus]KAG1213115.1 hypothetical protein G6F69_003092 [Rhizopus microsporus]KAG1231860.1 hypothetical protein G6F67_005445 [Rhizopus microsporus]KAG1264147.1 hypothetical protein G6F68_004572 [Rhizopus microsporus]
MKESVRLARYAVPTPVQNLATRPNPSNSHRFTARPPVLIMAPTRELCSQILDESRRFCYRSMLRPCCVYGRAGVKGQLNHLIQGYDVLVATLAHLLDFVDQGKIDLSNIRYLVLDEADRILYMGFERDMRTIIEPKVGRAGRTTTDITQKVHWVEEPEKPTKLKELLTSIPLVAHLSFPDQYLYQNKFPCTSIHGDRNQSVREDAPLAFKSGHCPILIATSVASRGIDIKNVMHVVNYDMAPSIDEYIHHIGRTARVGNAGLATSFFNGACTAFSKDLTKVLVKCGQELPNFLQPYRTNDV